MKNYILVSQISKIETIDDLKEICYGDAIKNLNKIQQANKESELMAFLSEISEGNICDQSAINSLLVHNIEEVYEAIGMNKNNEKNFNNQNNIEIKHRVTKNHAIAEIIANNLTGTAKVELWNMPAQSTAITQALSRAYIKWREQARKHRIDNLIIDEVLEQVQEYGKNIE